MEMANGFNRSAVRKAAFLLSILCLTALAAEAEEYKQRLAQAAAPPRTSAREFFIGQWARSGDSFFPDEIIFEADPASSDRLLVTFTLHCQRPSPACTATKAQSNAVFFTGGTSRMPMVNVPWFKDSAGNGYAVSFQMMPEGSKLVKGAGKEINAIFTITTAFNRDALFAGTEPAGLRYHVTAVLMRPPGPAMRLNTAPR